MLTKTEMNNILQQVNEAFSKLEKRVEKLETELAAKPSPAPARKTVKSS